MASAGNRHCASCIGTLWFVMLLSVAPRHCAVVSVSLQVVELTGLDWTITTAAS